MEIPLDKPIDEWKRRFRGMEPEQLLNAWSAKAKDRVSWSEDSNFHAAVAERFRQIGNMAIDLDEDQRLELCKRGNIILDRLQNVLKDEPSKLEPIRECVASSDAYFEKFGSRTARYYMYEQGVIDEWGDRVFLS